MITYLPKDINSTKERRKLRLSLVVWLVQKEMQAELDKYAHISLSGKSSDHNMETTNK
jgi:hypothetical protein